MVVLILGCVSVVSARGRKPNYEERTVYAPPVRRGSAANPNPAFAPPNFNNDPFGKPAVAPAGAPAASPSYNYGYDKAAASRSSAAAAASAKTKSAPPVDETEQTLPGIGATDSGSSVPSPTKNVPAATVPTPPVVPSTPQGQAPGAPKSPPASPAMDGVPTLPGFDAPAGNTTPPSSGDGLQAPSAHPTPTVTNPKS